MIGHDPPPAGAGGRPGITGSQSLIAALSDLVGAGLDPGAALAASARVLREAVGSDTATIYVVDPRRDQLLRAVTTEADGGRRLAKLAGRAPSQLPLLRALREAPDGVLAVPDTLASDALGDGAAERFGARAVLALVIGSAGAPDHAPEVEALAICGWRSPQPAVDGAQIDAARQLAALAAAAIANAQRHDEAERLARRLSELAGWAGRLASCEDPDAAVALAAEAAVALLDAPVAVLWSPRGKGWHPERPAGPDLGPVLAGLAAAGRRLAVMRRSELPPELAAIVPEGESSRLLAAAAGDGSALLAAGRHAPPGPVEEEIAPLLANLAAAALRSALAVSRLAEQALTDPLTEIGNRRAFETAFEAALAQAARYRRPLALALIDIDDFHGINERGGHPHGDRVLRMVARVLREELRRPDQAFRIGGDEFAVVVPETSAANAAMMLERVLARVRAGEVGEVTLSAGVAGAREGPVPDDDLLRRADESLYSAKRAGGDRVVAAPAADG